MGRLELRVPGLRDMAYRQRLLAQPETMAYNAGRDIDADGYDPVTGCIDFPPENWRWWRQLWLMNEPDFFSALLWDAEAARFVGEACWFYDADAEAHVAGILIEAEHRGKGYCAEGLRLLIAHAFRREGIDALRCELSSDNVAACRGYLRAGFHEYGGEAGRRVMICTREDFERDH